MYTCGKKLPVHDENKVDMASALSNSCLAFGKTLAVPVLLYMFRALNTSVIAIEKLVTRQGI